MQIKHGDMLSNLLIMEAVVGHNFLVVPHVLCDILKKEKFMTRGVEVFWYHTWSNLRRTFCGFLVRK